MTEFSGLPGADWIRRGLAELIRGEHTSEALCVAGSVGLLRSLAVDLPAATALPADPEIRFYLSLAGRTDDPYGRYNAMRRELDSFASALYTRRKLAGLI